MKHVIGICNIGQHVNKTGYIVIPFKSGANAFSPFLMGEPIISISNVEMESKGLAIIVQRLTNPVGLEFKEVSFLDEATKKRMFKLKKDYSLVSVELLRDDNDEIKIIPLHGKRGWDFVRRPEEIQLCRLPSSNGDFMKLLSNALDLAS